MCGRIKHGGTFQFQIPNSRFSILNVPSMSAAAEPKPAARLKPRSLLGVLSFLRPYPGRVALCLGLLLINIAIEMTLPQVLGNAITGLRNHLADGMAFSIWPFVLLYLALVSVRAGVGFVLGPIRNRAIQTTLGDIRAALYNALQRLAFTYHDKASSGELISRATTDVWRLQDFLFACLLLSVDIAVSLVATTTLIFLISPALGAVALGTMLPTVALISFYAGKLQPQWRNVHDQHGAMTTVIQENIAGVRVVKAFAREQSEINKFRGRKDTYLATLLDTVNFWASRVPRAQFLYGLSMPLALWIGGREVINGTMPIGDLAKVVFYLMAIGHRVGMVGQFTNILQNASASAERVLEIIREPQTLRSGSRPLPPGRGEVRFEHVSFNYPAGKPEQNGKPTDGDTGESARPALKDIHFAAPPGQTIAIVGPTGSGKTTLVNLIPRFYDPTSGAVLVDGVDVRELDLAQLRRSVGVIFQETFLFSASVAENIAYGRPGASRAEIQECARAAQAHDFIAELEDGYDTVIGERGVSLSGGQRQRIAIARAFLMDPRILVLDDATASVDSQTERLIQEAMQRLCRGRTTFVIAQRLSTMQHADQILLLEDGRLVSQGSHRELLQRSESYRRLFHPPGADAPETWPAAPLAQSRPVPET
jgi:ATP-binding cassette subfamily B protein